MKYFDPGGFRSFDEKTECSRREVGFGHKCMGCGQNMQCPSQTYVLRTWSPAGSAILGGCGNLWTM